MIEIAIVAGLILLNGVFAMSELAIVSARKPRLKSMAEAGDRGARAALALAQDPGKFLSTVQIGITLIGIIAGAFSGATLGGSLSRFLLDIGLAPALATALGYGGVVAIITYLSVVVGELVPKQFALRHAEAIASLIARPMSVLSMIGAPLVWLLDSSTKLIFRAIGMSEVAEDLVSEEEIKAMIATAAETGVIERDEKQMIAGVLRLSDSSARAVMTPRTDVDWIDITDPMDIIAADLAKTRHSRLPVADGDPDNIIGVLVVRHVLAEKFPDTQEGLRRALVKVPVIPDTLGALEVLDRLRKSEHPIVLIHDEYGHFEGVVTPADLLEAIAGAFRSDLDDAESTEAVQREDGSWLIAGSMPAAAMAELLGLSIPVRRDYQTAAGFVLHTLEHLPKTGQYLDIEGWRLEVVDMDGRRIDKIMAFRHAPGSPSVEG